MSDPNETHEWDPHYAGPGSRCSRCGVTVYELSWTVIGVRPSDLDRVRPSSDCRVLGTCDEEIAAAVLYA